jgi:serine/threonine protein kinase/sugar lactone lactonase YvrE
MDEAWTSERFERVNAIADAALEKPAGARDAYVYEACGTDAALRRDVEALLAAHSDSEGFLDASLLELLTKDIRPTYVTVDLAGRRIDRYKVISRLGAGGIGEVWLANDTELPRKIAIKMLSPRLAGDADHIRRFQQEARAASLLNHPNIVTIYDVGKWEGVDFIAEEFVAGETLRARLNKGRLDAADALAIGLQVAGALAAAHEAGIVHRDIKPENIMIRPDGLVKVLDFGLARFVEHGSLAGDDSLSRPGVVFGTVRYMSPEQAQGLALDTRSDLFSLGAVLYEMLAGRPPFTGATSTDVLAAILHQEPQPLCGTSPDIGAELEAVVRRCLEKESAKRYPSAAKLRRDLRNIAVGFAPVETPSDDLNGLLTPFSEARRKIAARWEFWAAVIGVTILISLSLLVLRRRPEEALDKMAISRLETRGESSDAAISPDAKYVAYVLRTQAGEGIWNAQLQSGSDLQVVPPEPGEHVGMKFSSDGAYLYYRMNSGNGEHDLYRVPALGGIAVKISSDVPGSIALSPDGRHIAFIRIDPEAGAASLMAANADGSGVHVIRTKRRPEYYSRNGIAWSPDGHSIACFTGNATGFDARAFRLVSVTAADGKETAISGEGWAWVDSIAWAPGFLAVSASREREDAFQIWRVQQEGNLATRITNDLSSYRRITVTSVGKTLEAVQTHRDVDLWVTSAAAPELSARIVLENVHGMDGLVWTRDGTLAFTASSGERRNIWVMDALGGHQRQIGAGPADKQELALTRDGRYFLFASRGTIWRMGVDGGYPLQLTRGAWSVHPASSADSRFVYYTSFRNWSPAIWGKPTLWRTPVDGGEPAAVISDAVSFSQISPDGQEIACSYYPGPNPEYSASPLAVFRAMDGHLLRVFDDISAAGATWTPDGKALIYPVTTNGVDNLWRVPLGLGPVARVTHFQTEDLFAYAFSPDFKSIAMGRGREATDVVLISGFR